MMGANLPRLPSNYVIPGEIPWERKEKEGENEESEKGRYCEREEEKDGEREEKNGL